MGFWGLVSEFFSDLLLELFWGLVLVYNLDGFVQGPFGVLFWDFLLGRGGAGFRERAFNEFLGYRLGTFRLV